MLYSPTSKSSPSNSINFENRIYFSRKEKFTIEIRCKNREDVFNKKRTSFLKNHEEEEKNQIINYNEEVHIYLNFFVYYYHNKECSKIMNELRVNLLVEEKNSKNLFEIIHKINNFCKSDEKWLETLLELKLLDVLSEILQKIIKEADGQQEKEFVL